MLKSNRAAVEREMVALIRKRNAAAAIVVEGNVKRLTPVDTGRLRAAQTHDSDETGAIVGNNISYGPMVELGTSEQAAQPHLVPGLLMSKAALRQIYGS